MINKINCNLINLKFIFLINVIAILLIKFSMKCINKIVLNILFQQLHLIIQFL